LIALLFLNVTIDDIVLITPSISWIEMAPKFLIGRKSSASFLNGALLIYLITGVLIILTIFFSYLRYLDFFSENWDLGINMQQLWTTTHGSFLYDSGDYEYYGVLSHLEVHSSFIAYPVSFIYLLFPSSLTMFSIQSVMVFTSVPILYFLSLEITNNRKISTVASLLYAFNATLITSVLYDYHWLSFMPLYTFSFLYLLLKKKFMLSSIVIVIGCLTEEAFTFISISVLLFLFMNDIKLSLENIINQIKKEWKLVALGIFAIAVYAFLIVIQHYLIPVYLNNESGISLLIKTTSQPILPTAKALYKLPETLEYWGLTFAMLCFIPFFYRKSAYIILIWLVETILFVPHYATVGTQYSLVTLSLLGPTIPYGLLTIKNGFVNSKGLKKIMFLPLIPLDFLIAISINNFSIVFLSLQIFVIAIVFSFVVDILLYLLLIKKKRDSIIKYFREHRGFTYALFLILIVSMNLMVSPLNPQNDHNAHLLGGGYRFQYCINPESNYMGYIQKEVGDHSTIIASNNLFPYVANNRFAYSLANSSNYKILKFPYNNTNLPQFILLSSSQEMFLFSWIRQDLNNSVYGIAKEIIYAGYPGNITLWKLNYTGSATYYYA
jgi:uncharacterized membrane protein